MKIKTKENNLALYIILGFLLISIIVTGSFCSKEESYSQEEKALLKVDTYDWGYNVDDESELLFDYWINNYGKVEAKEIEVECKLSDKYENVKFSGIDYFGNLASHSTEFGEFLPKKPQTLNLYEEYSGYCYVKSCDNCEILYHNIPELKEAYEK